MDFRAFLKTNIVYLDGGMGTMLQAQGLGAGELPERWNLTRADVIQSVHKAYYEAGSHVISTNTFGANALKYSAEELEQIIKAAVDNAKAARATVGEDKPRFIALDIGPTGKLLEPFGDLAFEAAVAAFAKAVQLGVKYGVDLIIIETMSDSLETKAAVLAAKENSNLPVLVSNAYEQGGRLMMGTTPAALVAMLEGLGVDAIGANCSFGPKQLAAVAAQLVKHASVPVFVKPNAGLPQMVDGKVTYDVAAEAFADDVANMLQGGVRMCGGCCGTTPAHIAALTARTAGMTPVAVAAKADTVIATGSDILTLGEDETVVSYHLTAAENEEFAAALADEDMDYATDEAVDQQDEGADILAVSVAADGIDEVAALKNVVGALQSMVRMPLLLRAEKPAALELALRHYNGKALIGNVDTDNMSAVFPLIKKYGGVVIVTITDENEISAVLSAATAHGIAARDLMFDTADSNVLAHLPSAYQSKILTTL